MPKRYSSAAPGAAADGNEVITTEGMSFQLDDVEFVCHGQFDANDLVDLAPLLEAEDGNWFDPAALAAVGLFYKQFMGTGTYRQFQAHRRAHRTPPSVIAEIMMDLLKEAVERPPARPSPSPNGPPGTGGSSPAASPPGGFPAQPQPQGQPEGPEAGNPAADIIPADMMHLAEVQLAPAPPAGHQSADPMAGTHRTVNLGDAARTRVEPAQVS